MEEGRSPRLKVVREPAAAAFLTNPVTLRQLEPFLGQECTVGRAAAQTRDKPNTVLKRVRRLVALGLLEMVREVPRKGRAMKVYRTSAEIFFVPFEATSAESLEAALAQREGYWERLLRRSVVQARMADIGTWGTRIYRDARGRLQVQTAVTPERNYTMLDPDRPAVLSAWRDAVMLDFDDAKALQRELFALLKRYQQKRGAQRYIVHLALAPLLP
jgi:hypothetical protein